MADTFPLRPGDRTRVSPWSFPGQAERPGRGPTSPRPGDLTTLSDFPLAGCGAADCSPTWTLDLGSPVTTVAAVAGGSTVFVLRGTDLVAVDRATGTIAWTAPLDGAATGLAVTDDTVYAPAPPPPPDPHRG
jgi:hypothetical protein